MPTPSTPSTMEDTSQETDAPGTKHHFPRSTSHHRLRKVVIGLVIVSAVVIGLIASHHNQQVARTNAMRQYCATLSLMGYAANENNSTLFSTLQQTLGTQAASLGGEILSNTEKVELDLGLGLTTDATARLQVLRDDCAAAGDPT